MYRRNVDPAADVGPVNTTNCIRATPFVPEVFVFHPPRWRWRVARQFIEQWEGIRFYFVFVQDRLIQDSLNEN
jgi:hypothetical protein